jgi:ribosomal-protein-alanine N-acetyltransferase
MIRLSTKRLDLVSATLKHISAELKGAEQLALLLGAEVANDWPPGQYDRNAQEYFRDRLQEVGSSDAGWYTWYAITREQPATVIGAGGYLGPPNGIGEVEIGFSVIPLWRRQGYATELVQALISNAFTDPRVTKIIAHTALHNHESHSVLLRTGFINMNTAHENDDIRFELIRKEMSVAPTLSR